jgi:hypothetical protein
MFQKNGHFSVQNALLLAGSMIFEGRKQEMCTALLARPDEQHPLNVERHK